MSDDLPLLVAPGERANAWWKAAGISFYQLDVTSSSQIAEVAKEIRKAHADPTVLVSTPTGADFSSYFELLIHLPSKLDHISMSPFF